MQYYVDMRTFAQILLLTLAPCTEISASEIPSKVTHVYSTGGLAAGSRQTAHAANPWHKILNSGGIVSNTQEFNELDKSQLSTQDDIRSIKYTDQITSVLDATGLEHLKQCASYLNEDDMGIKNIKLKADLLQGLEIRQEHDFKPKRPSKYACKELFTLILN
jgi:hypothetical protein